MFRYILKRILSLIPVFICISIILYAIVKMMPGDPVRLMLPTSLKQKQYEEAYDRMYYKMGMDKSVPEQYVRWMIGMFQGDFGHSTRFNRPVSEVIGGPMKNTLYLNLIVLILEISIVLPVGIRMATKRLSLFDNFWQVFSLVTYSMPSFFVALCLIFAFGVKLKWLPMGGMPNSAILKGADYFFSYLRYAVLPAVTLTVINVAGSLRYVRNSMIDALSQDYIRTARSKGLNEKVVVYSHAFRNALIPVSTVLIASVFAMFVGSPITETVFSWNGIGRILIDGLNNRDFKLVATVNWIFALMYVLGNFVADIVYGLVDPRVKLN